MFKFQAFASFGIAMVLAACATPNDSSSASNQALEQGPATPTATSSASFYANAASALFREVPQNQIRTAQSPLKLAPARAGEALRIVIKSSAPNADPVHPIHVVHTNLNDQLGENKVEPGAVAAYYIGPGNEATFTVDKAPNGTAGTLTYAVQPLTYGEANSKKARLADATHFVGHREPCYSPASAGQAAIEFGFGVADGFDFGDNITIFCNGNLEGQAFPVGSGGAT